MARDCSCDGICQGYAHCVCLFDHKTGLCGYYCSDPVAKARNSERDGAAEKVALDSRVNVDMRDALLGEAGKLLAEIADAEIYVPADRMDERRTLDLKEVSLETVVRELGLMAVVRP